MHIDHELVSLLALGEDVGTPDDRAHAQSCPACAEEIADLQRLVTLGRMFGNTDQLLTPSPLVWARIQDELELSARSPAPRPGQDSAVGLADVSLAQSAPAAQQPRPSLMTAVATILNGSDHGAAALVAQGRLAPPPGAGGGVSGEAVIATDELGRRILQVALDVGRPTSGIRRAWLVHRDDPGRRQSLGVLDGAYGVWTIDRSIDLAQYPIVDISQQEADETEHSGRSIVRGELALAV